MRPVFWTEIVTVTLISAVLASPVLAQTPPAEQPPAAEQAAPPPIRVAVDPPPAPPNQEFLTNVIWLEQPDAQVFARFYPQPAIDREAEGRVTLDCVIGEGGRLTCTVVSEDPPGLGFAYATLSVARYFRAAPQTRDGVNTAGGRIRRSVRWLLLG